jgi:hypothetical protein
MITFEINRLVKGSHAQNSAFLATLQQQSVRRLCARGGVAHGGLADSRAILNLWA